MKRTANTQVAWALLAEGVTQARVDAHRLQHLIQRAVRVVDASGQKDEVYQQAGDLVMAVPERLGQLISSLDRTSLVLSKLGEDFLSSHLSLSERTKIEDALAKAGSLQNWHKAAIQRVALRYLEQA